MSESQATHASSIDRLTVRTYRADDHDAVMHLYREGLLAGQIDPYDTAADLEDIEVAYLQDEGSHFWVAELDGNVIGTIGLAAGEEHTAEIRRLRVAKNWQGSGVAATLLETALAHCKHHGYLKVRLDTRFDPQAALGLFDRFGFQHTRTRAKEGKELLEFYLDLYRSQE
jgi:putative acetyltransferase